MSTSIAPKTILILAANPHGTTPLRLAEEVREIEAGLLRSQHRHQFQLKQCWATRPLDMQRAMLDEAPQIVHFCGHGAGIEGLVLEDDSGEARSVSSTALASLFSLLADRVECVLLNACYSAIQAEAIAQHIGTVIGMDRAIGDRTAIKFAISFYDALGAGRGFEFAYQWGKAAIAMEGIDDTLKLMLLQPRRWQPEPATPPRKKRIFISYTPDTVPDEPLALEIARALRERHAIAINQTMLAGTQWVEWIDDQIRRSDFLVVLLSKTSVQSEMIRLEIETAHQLAQHQGQPQILPVRLAYPQPFQYPLNEYLTPLSCVLWRDPQDTPTLIANLQKAILNGKLTIDTDTSQQQLLQTTLQTPLPASLPVTSQATPPSLSPPSPVAQPLTLELPEGTMDLESRFYVERRSDTKSLNAIQRQGVTIPIKGPRQMGKSSLLNRILQAARSQNKRNLFLDFQLFDKAALVRDELFYQRFCRWLTLKLRLSDRVEDWWQLYGQMGNPLCCTFYLQDYLLPEADNPVVLAMDEVESIFSTPFRSEFFAMLRSWHNSRATEPIWKQLDLALVTSTEPYQLIQDLNQSPFNVGEVVELEDFTPEQVADLNQRHGSPLSAPQQQQLMQLVQGHPYLVRRALYLVASGNLTVTSLFKTASAERGPFGDHLRYHLFRLYDQEPLVQGMLQILRQQRCPDERIFFRLRGAGLVRRQGQHVLPRCAIYTDYFREHLHD